MNCVFCSVSPADHLTSNELAIVIRDRFPVSPGHLLVITRRHVGTWFDATDLERLSLMQLLDHAKALIEAEHHPDGYNIGINAGAAAGQTVDHLHVHLIPRYKSDVDDPRGGVRHVIPGKGNYLTASQGTVLPCSAADQGADVLFRGQSTSLLAEIKRLLEAPAHDEIDIVIAFVKWSGLELVAGALEDAAQRGARLRILTTDYLGVTEPRALRWLLDRADQMSTRVFQSGQQSFHPKSWIFWASGQGAGRALVGSSNLTRAGLIDGVEWNLLTSGVSEARSAFEDLWHKSQATPLSEELLSSYQPEEQWESLGTERPGEISPPQQSEECAPRPIQKEALEALARDRAAASKAGLVVMATGLGKTWLAAFDSRSFRRVLFVAHREEILNQTRDVFRRACPNWSIGMFRGTEKRPEGDLVLASIMTLTNHLSSFDPGEFDYIVIDEFHHAAAKSYRSVIEFFTPKYLLGLTATPERMDGADLLELTHGNLVFNCDLVAGINRGELCPFDYHGLKDITDFAPIPWRNGKFDTEALTRAVATRERAGQALTEWQELGGEKTLGFCCSVKHADFMAEFFRQAGVRAEAVHSQPSSAPRSASLEAFEKGDLEVLFSIDVFNEGLDVPAVDTVLMLRGTDSPVIFLQQLGRGLRKTEGSSKRLTVIDFIGNHRSFLHRPRLLLSLGRPGPSMTEREALDSIKKGEFDLPFGCHIKYDLEVIQLFESLAKTSGRDLLTDFCRDFHDREEVRPTAAQALRAGLNPRRGSEDGWFGFLREVGLLVKEEQEALWSAGTFLQRLEKENLTKSFKLTTLRALLESGRLFSGMNLDELATKSHEIIARDDRLLDEVSAKDVGDPNNPDPTSWRRYWRKNPIAAWLGEGLRSKEGNFRLQEDTFILNVDVPEQHRDAAAAMVSELVELRMMEFRRRTHSPGRGIASCKVSHSGGKPMVFLDRATNPHLPIGKGIELLVDGSPVFGDFVKVALNVAKRPTTAGNALHEILRSWFGPSAGHPGTAHRVEFEEVDGRWIMRPKASPIVGAGGDVLPFFPSFRVACGTDPSGDPKTWQALPLPFRGAKPPTDQACFIAQARGDSMDGGADPIKEGDFLLFKWLTNERRADLVGERAIVEYDAGHGRTAALKTLRRDASEGFLLESDNPSYATITADQSFQATATLIRKLDQTEVNPIGSHLHEEFKRPDIVTQLYRQTYITNRWNVGHVADDEMDVLFITLFKKDDHPGKKYTNRVIAPDLIAWDSQSKTSPQSKKGRELINSLDLGRSIHIWIRAKEKQPFTCCGLAIPVAHEGSQPISFRFRLLTPLPGSIFAHFTPKT